MINKIFSEDEANRLKSNPTQSEVRAAYIAPKNQEHWERIQSLVLTGGFRVIDVASTKLSGPEMPEYRVVWPTQEQEDTDYAHFFSVAQLVIGTLKFSDEEYSQKILPQIFTDLEKTYLFLQLLDKPSLSQGNTIGHHIRTVAELVDTTNCSPKERFILRVTALFHDTGKAFNIGRDQLHYHALIASDIFNRFMQKYQEQLVYCLYQAEADIKEPLISLTETEDFPQKKVNNRQQLNLGFSDLVTQASELIRLHHVLEQIDKGVLDLETVALIFAEENVSPMLMGLFVVADGGSVIPDNEKYSKFLLQNMEILEGLIDLLNSADLLSQPEVPYEIKKTYVQALQYVLRRFVDFIKKLPEDIKEILTKALQKLDEVFSIGLLGLVSDDFAESLV